jgi:hypothetical protein
LDIFDVDINNANLEIKLKGSVKKIFSLALEDLNSSVFQ